MTDNQLIGLAGISIKRVSIATMSRCKNILIFLLLVATIVVAQESDDNEKEKKNGTFKKKLPVRLGSDGRPLLFAPKIEMCKKRKYISIRMY